MNETLVRLPCLPLAGVGMGAVSRPAVCFATNTIIKTSSSPSREVGAGQYGQPAPDTCGGGLPSSAQ